MKTLHEYANEGDYEACLELLDQGFAPNLQNAQGQTSLQVVPCNNQALQHLFLSRGADIFICDKNGNSALLGGGNPDFFTRVENILMYYLQSSYGNKNAPQEDKKNESLHAATRKGDLEQAQALLNSGFSVTQKNQYGKIPLLYADGSNERLVQLLIQHGSPFTIKSYQDKKTCIIKQDYKRVEIIISAIVNHLDKNIKQKPKKYPVFQLSKNTEAENQIYAALEKFNFSKANKYYQAATNNDFIACKLMHRAIKDNNSYIVLSLLKLNAEKNDLIHGVIDDLGYTPLHIAAYHNNINLVELLLANGANVNAIDSEGNTALHLSTSIEVMRYLVEQQADITIKNNKLQTAISSKGVNNFEKRFETIILTQLKYLNLKPPIKLRLGLELQQDQAYCQQVIQQYGNTKNNRIVISEKLPKSKRDKFYLKYAEILSRSIEEDDNFQKAIHCLENITASSKYFKLAQRKLFGLYFFKPLEKYQNLQQRLEDIKKALSYSTQTNQAEQEVINCWSKELKRINGDSRFYAEANYELFALTLDNLSNQTEFVTIAEQLSAAYRHLLIARLTGHDKARITVTHLDFLQDKYSSYSDLSLQQLIDSEMESRLSKIQVTDKKFSEAHRIQFEMAYYSRRCYKIYSDSSLRLQDIKLAIKHLTIALNSDKNLQHPFIELFKLNNVFCIDSSVDEIALETISKNLLIMEMQNIDDTRDVDFIYAGAIANKYKAENRWSLLYQKEHASILDFNSANTSSEKVRFAQALASKGEHRLCTELWQLGTLQQNNAEICQYSRGSYQIDVDFSSLTTNKVIHYKNKYGTEIARVESIDNKIYLTSFNYAIQLNCKGETQADVIELHNSNADITIAGDLSSKKSLLIFANTDKLCFQAEIQGKGNLQIDTSGELFLAENSKLNSDANIHFASETLQIKGKIHSAEKFISKTQRATALASQAVITANHVALSAHSFTDVRSKITAKDNLFLIGQENIYLHGFASLKSKAIHLSAKHLFATDKTSVSATEQLSCFSEDMTLDKDAHFESKKAITMKVDHALDNNGFIQAEEINFIIKKTVNKTNGKIIAIKSSQFAGNSVWNAGELHLGDNCNASLNNVFVHGVESSSQITRVIKDRLHAIPKLTCGKLNIISGAFVDLATSISVKTISSASILRFSLLSLIQRNYSQNTNLINVNLSAEIPNIPELLKSVKKTIKLIEAGKFNEAIQAGSAWDTALAIMPMGYWIVRHIVPLLSPATDIAWSIGMLILNSKQLFSACKNLYHLNRPIERRDVIPLLLVLKGFANEAVLVGMQATHLNGMDIEKIQLEGLSSSDITTYAASLLSTGYTQSLMNVTGGIQVTGSDTTSSALYFNLGGTRDAAIINDTALVAHHDEAIVAMKTAMQAEHQSGSGSINTQAINADIDSWHSAGDLHVRSGRIHVAEDWQQDGGVTLENTFVSAAHHEVGDSATLNLVNSEEKTAVFDHYGATNLNDAKLAVQQSLNQHGQLTISENSIASTKEYRSFQDSQTQGDGTLLITDRIAEAKGDTQPGILHLTDSNLTNSQALDLIQSQNEFKNIHSSTLIVETNTDVDVNRDIDTDRTIAIKAPHVTNNGRIHSSKPLILNAIDQTVDVNQAIESKETTLLADHAKVNINAVVTSESNHVKGETGVNIISTLKSSNSSDKPDVQQAGLLATHGNNTIESKSGGLNNAGGTVVANGSNHVVTQDDINLDNLTHTKHVPAHIDAQLQQHIKDASESEMLRWLMRAEDNLSRKEQGVFLNFIENPYKANVSDPALVDVLEKLGLISAHDVTDIDIPTQYVASQDNFLHSENGHINLKSSNIFSQGKSILDAHTQAIFDKNSTVTGYETYIIARINNVINSGKLIGLNYIDVKAVLGNVILKATASFYESSFGLRKQWQPGLIMGGEGKGHKGVGTSIYAGNQIVNIASQMIALGDNELFAAGNDKGIIFTPEAWRYTANIENDEGFLGFNSSNEITYLWDIQRAGVYSVNGHNTLGSNGDIDATAADFISKNGSTIYTPKNFNNYDFIVTNEVIKDESSWFGLQNTVTDAQIEQSMPSIVRNSDPQGVTHISVAHFYSRSGVYDVAGVFKIDACTIEFDQSILHANIHQTTSGLTFSAAGIPIIGSQAGSFPDLAAIDPMLASYNQFTLSGSLPEFAINGFNAFAATAASYQSLFQAYKQNTLPSALMNRYGLSPTNVSVGYTQTTTDSTQEFAGPGFIHTNNLQMNSSGTTTVAVPIETDELTVNAQRFTQRGLDLHSSYNSCSESVDYNFGSNSVSASQQTSSGESSIFSNPRTIVHGTATIHVNEWDVDGANNEIGKLQGEAKQINVTTHTNSNYQSSKSMSASTGGTFSFSTQEDSSVTLAEQSGIHVSQQSDFHVGRLNNTGGYVVFDEDKNWHANQEQRSNVENFSENEHHGVSINLPTMQSAMSTLNDISHSINEQPHPKNSMLEEPVILSNTDNSQPRAEENNFPPTTRHPLSENYYSNTTNREYLRDQLFGSSLALPAANEEKEEKYSPQRGYYDHPNNVTQFRNAMFTSQHGQRNQMSIGYSYFNAPFQSNQNSFLYRGTDIEPNNVFRNGFKSSGENFDLLNHAKDNPADSAYISTSKSFDVAIRFPQYPTSTRTYVYVLNRMKGVDVVAKLSDQIDLIDREDFELTYLAEQEIAIPLKIHPKDIKGAWSIDILPPDLLDFISFDPNEYLNSDFTRIKTSNFFHNPYYQPRISYADYVIKGFRGVGFGLTAFGMVSDGISWSEALQLSQATNNYNYVYRETARIASGWGASLAGGWAGAQLGGIACAPILPPFGSAVCGVSGGLVGGIVGYNKGSQISTTLYDNKINNKSSGTNKTNFSRYQGTLFGGYQAIPVVNETQIDKYHPDRKSYNK